MRSPAPTSSSSDTATCATTSAARNRPRGAPRGDASALMTDTRSTRELCSAGTKPNTSALAHGDQRRERDDQAVDVDVEENPLRRREPLGVADEHRDRRAARADAEDGAPGTASMRFSTTSRRTIRARVAPSARRTAISPRRETPRTSTRPAMFAQAISSTSRPIALSTTSVGSMNVWPPVGDCQNGTTRSVHGRRVERPIAARASAQIASIFGGGLRQREYPAAGSPCG